MPKILITGSNSFVGANFIKYSKYPDIEEKSLMVNKPEEIDFGKYDVVLHLAAIVHQSKKIPESEYFSINKDLCLRVALTAKKAGVKQFVFLSTCKVYGNTSCNFEKRNEDSVCFPDDPYGRSKYEAEIGLRKLEDADFTVSIIRTPLVYGEGVKANMLSIMKIVGSFPVLPFKSINNKRNFTYTENLVGFIDRIIDLKVSGVFIAMDEEAISTTDLINYLSKYLDKNVILFKLPKFIIRTGIFFIPGIFERLYGSLEFNNSKTKKDLNYNPPFSTEEGIKKMIVSYTKSKRR
jgi:nucleoside-diphosphate-sugar epimerase